VGSGVKVRVVLQPCLIPSSNVKIDTLTPGSWPDAVCKLLAGAVWTRPTV